HHRRAGGHRQRDRGRAVAAGDRGGRAAREPRSSLPPHRPRRRIGVNLGLGGKVALVTGGARDVGREISLTLAREGAAVAVNYMHSKADADSLVAEITGLGGRAAAYQGDVADYAAVSAMIDKIIADLGRLDAVVNSAGYVESKLVLETSHSDKEFIAKNRERILAVYPVRRLGKPEDVAPLVAFLASDLAGWVTGQTISVSGGYSTV